MYLVFLSKQAEKDKKLLKAAGLEKKARYLLEIIGNNPFQNPPPFETLVGNLSGFYSRRINIQHRLIYKVIQERTVNGDKQYDATVFVVRMWTHYEGL